MMVFGMALATNVGWADMGKAAAPTESRSGFKGRYAYQ